MDKNLLDWKASGEYFRYNGHKVFYKDTQDETKPCLICLHGFPASSWDWHKVWPELSKKYRVIAFDMLGFGFSDKPKHHIYSIHEQAQILINLLASKQVKQFHLIAHDFATLVAQELLDQKYQTSSQPKLKSLIAMSGSIFPELSNPRLIQKLLVSPLGFLVTYLLSERMFNRNISSVFDEKTKPDIQALKSYWDLMLFNNGHKQFHNLNFFLKDRKFHGERWKKNWQQTTIPVFYIAGANDPMYGYEVITQLKRLSQKQAIHVIEGSGHFPHVERPNEVLVLVENFIAQISGSME